MLSYGIYFLKNMRKKFPQIPKLRKLKWQYAGKTFFSPVVGHVLLSSKTYFTKISVSGGPCNIHFCSFLCAYCSFIVLIVNTTRRPLKLAMLATSFDIPATICPLVFYSHINAISSVMVDMYCLLSFYIIVFYFFIPSCFRLVPIDQGLVPICDMLIM